MSSPSEPISGEPLHDRRAKTAQVAAQGVRWVLPFLLAVLPILLLSLYTERTASQSVESLVDRANFSEANGIAELLSRDVDTVLSITQGLAALPTTRDALQSLDDETLLARLRAVVYAYPQVERASITDREGMVISDYPSVPGSFDLSVATESWYEELLQLQAPTVSSVSVSPLASRLPIINVAAPVLDEDGNSVGTLVLQYSLKQATRWLQNARLGQRGSVFVIDYTGILAAHPTVSLEGEVRRQYGNLPLVQQGLAGQVVKTVYRDPLSNEDVSAVAVPFIVGRRSWAAVAEQSVEEAFAPLRRVRFNVGLAGFLLSLLTCGFIVTLARSFAHNQRLNRELNEKNQRLKDVASIASHQLKAPMTAIGWTLELLLDGTYGTIADDVRGPIVSMQDIVKQCYRLITDILNVSRIDRGVVGVKLVPVNLKEAIELAVRAYRPTFIQKKLELKIEHQGVPLTVLGDLDKLAEAVGNSVSNALKHTEKGSITVRSHGDLQKNMAVIEVIDTGKGMPQEILEKLFTRDQIVSDKASPESSAGLGLYITREFMQIQHGDVSASSELGKGSTFTYTIPLAPTSV